MTAAASQPIETTDGTPHARRVIVHGLGRAGIAYAMAIATTPGFALAGFVEPRGDLRAFARGAGFGVPAASTLSRLLAKVPAGAAVVAVPREERVAAVEGALDAKLAVLVDGLPAAHGEGAARLAPRIESASAPVGCAVGALFHPLFARASRVLASGVLGRAHEVRASAYVSRVFAAGAPPVHGDVLDATVAELLVLLDALFGPVRAVSASGNRLYGERFDELHGQLALADGTEIVVDGSWSVPGYPRTALVVEVLGERGALLVSDDALEADLAEPCDIFPAGHTRRVFAEEPDPVAFEAGEAGPAFAAFARALAGSALPDTLDARGALRTVSVVDALRTSATRGGERCEVAR